MLENQVLEPCIFELPFTRSNFQEKRSVDRGSSDCFQMINVLKRGRRRWKRIVVVASVVQFVIQPKGSPPALPSVTVDIAS